MERLSNANKQAPFLLGLVKGSTDKRMMMCVYHSGDKRRAEIVFSEMVSLLDLEKVPIISPMEGSFDETVKPYFDKAEFVMFMLTSSADGDEFMAKVFSECNNINKRLIPVKIYDEDFSLVNFHFRSEMVDYTKPAHKAKLIEQMRAWLGVTISNETKPCPNCRKTIRKEALFCKWCGKKIK